jgi:hypothetical protein
MQAVLWVFVCIFFALFGGNSYIFAQDLHIITEIPIGGMTISDS